VGQISLLSIPQPTVQEIVKDRLRGFMARQHARNASRTEKRARWKRNRAQPPRRAQQEMLTGMRQPSLFELEPTAEAPQHESHRP
jgi:hypothetical protein